MVANMVRRLLGAGQECVVFHIHPQAAVDPGKLGAIATRSLSELIAKLKTPRTIWIMIRASVVDATLCDLARLLGAHDTVIDEGRWTLKAAITEGVPAPVLSTALTQRFASRGNEDFANKLLSALRYQFGGHKEKP
jgi:6-phosphogluconate dehydrogenase